MTSEQACPIWDGPPSAQDVAEVGQPCDSPRAGGRFMLMPDSATCLQKRLLTDRQRANLSYRIYRHNLDYRLFDDRTSGERPIVVDQEWVENNQDRTPSASERMLTFLRELIRCDDAGREPHEGLQRAAGGCRHGNDLKDLRLYALDRGWLQGGGLDPDTPSFPHPRLIDLDLGARLLVEEHLGAQDHQKQAFVAMWFAPFMEEVYDLAFAPAIEAAGYEPVRIDRKEFLGKVDDEILAEIRKSKFVVADFTTDKEAGVRGGVYYEAGFAQGLGLPAIHTCRSGLCEVLHFDTSHINHLFWENTEDLRGRLQNRIEAIVGRGPYGDRTD